MVVQQRGNHPALRNLHAHFDFGFIARLVGMRGDYAANRGWAVALQVKEVGSGAAQREQRQQLIDAARRRDIDVVLVWRLDRWGRSLLDLVTTLQELTDLKIGFVSLTEALDLTTSTGRAMAGMLSVFAALEHDILRDRVRAGLDHARQAARGSAGPPLRRPMHLKSGNCSARESANPKSPGVWTLAEPPYGEYQPKINLDFSLLRTLTANSQTIEAVFPKALVQLCIVHTVRHCL